MQVHVFAHQCMHMLISRCHFCPATWSYILLYRSRFWGDPGACHAPDLNLMFAEAFISSVGVISCGHLLVHFALQMLILGSSRGLPCSCLELHVCRCMYLLISRCHFCAATWSCILLYRSRSWGDPEACHAPDWNFMFAGACMCPSARVASNEGHPEMV